MDSFEKFETVFPDKIKLLLFIKWKKYYQWRLWACKKDIVNLKNNMKTMKKYHNLYLDCNVLLVTDVIKYLEILEWNVIS